MEGTAEALGGDLTGLSARHIYNIVKEVLSADDAWMRTAEMMAIADQQGPVVTRIEVPGLGLLGVAPKADLEKANDFLEDKKNGQQDFSDEEPSENLHLNVREALLPVIVALSMGSILKNQLSVPAAVELMDIGDSRGIRGAVKTLFGRIQLTFPNYFTQIRVPNKAGRPSLGLECRRPRLELTVVELENKIA